MRIEGGAGSAYEASCLQATRKSQASAAAFSGQLFDIQEWRCLDIPLCLFSDQTRYIC